MSEYVSFCFMFHVPHLLARLSRAIQHIFSRLVGAQYTDCITLPHQHALCLGLHKPSQFRPFTYIYEFEQVYMCFIPNVSHLSIPACPHRPSRLTMDHHLKGQPHHLDVQRATLAPICLPAHILSHSSPLNPRYPVQASPQLKWKNTFTPQQSHQEFRANPTEGCHLADHSSLYSPFHTPPHTLIHISVSIT